MTQQKVQIKSHCHTCGRRARAEKRSGSLLAGLWRWHTGWCPGWKAYVKELERKGLEVPTVRARTEA
ncbi:MAG: hypothetical protein P8Y03_26195 [Anaerolineales bacterium]